MRGLSEKEFANVFQDCFLSVWIDETSSYGTFPLESMKCGVPVLGLTPNMVPQWMNSDNGLWVNNKIQMVDFVADFLQNWLEDNVKDSLYEEMLKTVENLPTKEYFEEKSVSLFEGYINTRLTSFEEQLTKLEIIEE
jgi:glycosyltransferase involved in cell wall biosynthesis